MDRKRFIQTSGRWGILAIMGVVVGLLVKNNSINAKPTPAQKCQGCKLNPENCNKQDCDPEANPGSKIDNQP